MCCDGQDPQRTKTWPDLNCCKISITHIDPVVSAMAPLRQSQHPPVADENVAEQIPCAALVLGLFAWRSGAKLGAPERVRS